MKPHVINAALQVLRAEGWTVDPHKQHSASSLEGYIVKHARYRTLIIGHLPHDHSNYCRVLRLDGECDHLCERTAMLLEAVDRLAGAGLLPEPAATAPVEAVPAAGSKWAQRLGLTAEDEQELQTKDRMGKIRFLRDNTCLSLRQARDEIYARFYPEEHPYP